MALKWPASGEKSQGQAACPVFSNIEEKGCVLARRGEKVVSGFFQREGGDQLVSGAREIKPRERLLEPKNENQRGAAGMKERVFSGLGFVCFFSFESVKITPLQNNPPF